MLPIHKLCCPAKDNLRPALQYFRVFNSEVWATNTHLGAILPAMRVFGVDPDRGNSPVIHSEDCLYFKASEWQSSKMDKAAHICRDGLLFTAKDRKLNVIGRVQALTEPVFEKEVAVYPPLLRVMPDVDAVAAITRIVLNPSYLVDIAAACGYPGLIRLEFTGVDRGIKVFPLLPSYEEESGFACRIVLMPGLSAWSEAGPACSIMDSTDASEPGTAELREKLAAAESTIVDLRAELAFNDIL